MGCFVHNLNYWQAESYHFSGQRTPSNTMVREYNFDGLVGPTHNYGGLSRGNVASASHGGEISSPKEAALQGLAKMEQVAALGVAQAVLPPHPRPHLFTLRQLGFQGTDEEVISAAASEANPLLRLCSSAAAMWTANAATVSPSSDTQDGRVHLTPANLQAFFHRTIEARTTERVLRSIFKDTNRFCVHSPLPGGGQFSDEGAANHLRLVTAGRDAVNLFAWGKDSFGEGTGPQRFPARQTLQASAAIARRHRLDPADCLFPQQAPEGIDAGAFHTDVLASGNENFVMLHEKAFIGTRELVSELGQRLGSQFRCALAGETELPVGAAVEAYPFNSQLLTVGSGQMVLLAPSESRENVFVQRFIERVLAEDNPLTKVLYLDLRQSMRNGGGPACLRLRVALTDSERSAISANVFFTPELNASLVAWVKKHYRDRLSPKDLADPLLARESMAALDELTGILGLGSVYDFQISPEPPRD